MKRMERLERAVGELQRRLLQLSEFSPSHELDMMSLPASCMKFLPCRDKRSHDIGHPDNNAMMGDESGVFVMPPAIANGEEAEL